MSPRVYVTKFDHDEARRRHAAGETIGALAREYGVKWAAVARVVDLEFRKKFDGRSRDWIYAGKCPDCGAPATRAGEQSRCRPCAALHQATSVRDNELKCVACNEWKPDDAFPRNRACNGVRRGRHTSCRPCLTKAKREWRERNRVPCVSCGTLVDGKNRRYPEKPHECISCVNTRRIRDELGMYA